MASIAAGAILAGGASSRFGSPKCVASLDDLPLIRRVAATLTASVTDAVVITDDPALARLADLPHLPDDQPGHGPLGGLATALGWSHERGHDGVLIVGCDMPFISTHLLNLILDAAAGGVHDVVVPLSGADDRIEPMCAWYSARVLPIVERRSKAGQRSLIGLIDESGAHRIPLDAVSMAGDPERLFLNINTPADLRRAEQIMANSRGHAR
jgi:molybdopterin-guanine dinucleotide biosynthesis protein A